MSNRKLQEILDSDPFGGSDVNLDLTGLGIEQPSRSSKSDFPTLLTEETLSQQALKSINITDDMIEELVRRQNDPSIREAWISEQTERIALDFRHANPGYLKTEANSSAIIQALSRRHLKVDTLDDTEAIIELYKAGHWSVADLTSEYTALLTAGELEVPRGHMKELSNDEKLQIITLVRSGDLEGGVLTYISFALGGRLPRYHSPTDFLAKNPKLASAAAVFVWRHSRPEIDGATFREFANAKLSGVPLLTYKTIEKLWDAHQNQRWLQAEFQGPQAQLEQPINLNSLSDTEIKDLYLASVRERTK